MIEDTEKKEQMLVMNGHTGGGSAFIKGRIEIMINRRMSTGFDDLGNEQPLDEFETYESKNPDNFEGDHITIPTYARFKV